MNDTNNDNNAADIRKELDNLDVDDSDEEPKLYTLIQMCDYDEALEYIKSLIVTMVAEGRGHCCVGWKYMDIIKCSF